VSLVVLAEHRERDSAELQTQTLMRISLNGVVACAEVVADVGHNACS